MWLKVLRCFVCLQIVTLVGAITSVAAERLGTLHRRTYFYVGQHYASPNPNGTSNGSIADGQMYVEHLVPERVTRPFPIVFIHGNGMTGTNLLNTPDGRRGWADFFLSKGYEVFLLDQPSRGRSAWQSAVDGAQTIFDTLTTERRFTAPERFQDWPQAILHTQWLGNGSLGDPIFDTFYAGVVPSLQSDVETQQKFRDAGSLLLDKIGPVILLTHSQSGPLGWLLGDARPSQVKAIVALEPSGPPFQNAVTLGSGMTRAWGPTSLPVLYSPAALTPESINKEIVEQDLSVNYTCWQQVEPARKLVNLAKIPVLIVTSEASEHSVYDGCTARYLTQASVLVNHVRLEERGIHGNGHLMFMEKNSEYIVGKVVEPFIASIRV